MKVLGSLPLVGGGGEKVDFRRTIASHGVATLAPQSVDLEHRVLETTIALDGEARTVRVREGAPGHVVVETAASPSRRVGAKESRQLVQAVRHLLRLDEDLSPFYVLASADPALSWVVSGAGRLLRSPTVFEDVVKTICTTNCTWSSTVRMTEAVVGQLGPVAGDGRRAFPSPAVMADAGEAFYQQVARAGYRGRYLLRLATEVAEGRLDLEELNDPDLPDVEVEQRLLALPGVGPYAAAHVMLTALGRYGRLILDSWTRPTYARLAGRPASDRAIERRFRRYRRYAGLAFWMYLTEDWVVDDTSTQPGPL
jgi:3-methyladenine DNA glycosylase/8-oxoguanine DNA glycosylase